MNMSITKKFSKKIKLLFLIHILLLVISFLVIDNILLREIAKHETKMRGFAEGRINQMLGQESETSFEVTNEKCILICDYLLSYLSQNITLKKQLEEAWGKGYASSGIIGTDYGVIQGRKGRR